MPETQPQETRSRIIPLSADEYIIMQIKDLKEEFRDSRKEFSSRMDRLEARQDKLEAKIDATRKELNDKIDKQDQKIDKLADKIDSSMKHSQILAGSCLGITIAVLLALFLK